MIWVSGQNFKKCEFFTNGQLLEVESQFWNYWSLFLASEVLPLASSYKMFYHLPPIGKLFEIYHLPPIIAQSYKSLDFLQQKGHESKTIFKWIHTLSSITDIINYKHISRNAKKNQNNLKFQSELERIIILPFFKILTFCKW